MSTLRAKSGRVELAPPGPTTNAGFTEDVARPGDEVTAIGNRSQDETEKRMKAVRIIVGGKTYDVYPSRLPGFELASRVETWLADLEQLALIRAVKISFFAYPLINAAHIAAIGRPADKRRPDGYASARLRRRLA
jgi:hypothetical protein